MTLSKPRAVIFDWDDTLVDTWPTSLQAMNEALAGMNHETWSDVEARRRCGASARDLFRQLFGDRWQEADRIYLNAYMRIAEEIMPPHAQAEDVLKALAGYNVYLAVVSNKRGQVLRSEAARLKFDKYFSRIIGAGDAAADKPDPAPVHLALHESGIAPGQDVWFVGDSHTDMQCALNAGCAPVLLETKLPPEELLLESPPLQRFRGHYDLMEFINRRFN